MCLLTFKTHTVKNILLERTEPKDYKTAINIKTLCCEYLNKMIENTYLTK